MSGKTTFQSILTHGFTWEEICTLGAKYGLKQRLFETQKHYTKRVQKVNLQRELENSYSEYLKEYGEKENERRQNPA